ncbi:MAG: amidase [Rubellimicrobium sp.]|nr:amidase [Rubellimicrobium sp.]
MGDIDGLYREADAVELAGRVRAGEVTATEVAEAAIRAIEALNPRLNAVICDLRDIGRAAARDWDARGADAPLKGVPFLLKELASGWGGVQATNASRFLLGMRAAGDSVVVERIKAAGLCLMGKTNAPENGWSLDTRPAVYGATINPWDAALTPGGSSGGSAVAVASGMVPIAEASDGAGSIRVPASCCGVVGLKPSRGRVTLAPFADYWSGGAYFLCNSRTVRDTAAYLDAVGGAVPGDIYGLEMPRESFAAMAARAPARLRVGFTVTDPAGNPVDPGIAAGVRSVARTLEGLGHEVEEHDLPIDAGHLWQTYTDMTCVETAAGYGQAEAALGRSIGPGDVEPLTMAVIARGRAASGIEHQGRVSALRGIGRAIVQDLLRYDVYLTPTLTQPPRPAGFYDMSMTDLDAYNALWRDAVFMTPFNISGQPAMSLPLAQAGHMPAGVQLVGRIGDEGTLLAVATVLEQAMPWAGRRPPLRL